MKTLVRTTLALAAVALFSMTASDANAQQYGTGYSYGLGFSQGTTFYSPGRTGLLGNGRGFVRRGARRGGVVPFGFGIGGGLLERSEDLPYFAKFPPVYYNGIVKRPYGISPFATPPGIVPTEMQVAPKVVAERVVNPYFEDASPKVEVKTEATQPQEVPAANDKSAKWTANPYSEWQVSK